MIDPNSPDWHDGYLTAEAEMNERLREVEQEAGALKAALGFLLAQVSGFNARAAVDPKVLALAESTYEKADVVAEWISPEEHQRERELSDSLAARLSNLHGRLQALIGDEMDSSEVLLAEYADRRTDEC